MRFLLAQSILMIGLVATPVSALALPCGDWVLNSPGSTAQDSWDPSEFTDPRFHDPLNYRLITHAISAPGTLWSNPSASRMVESILENPENIKRAGALSCRVVANSHPRAFPTVTWTVQKVEPSTFKPFGFILKVPKENFVATSVYDMNSGRLYDFEGVGADPASQAAALDEVLARLAIEFPVRSRTEVEDGSGNEAVVRASTGFGAISVTGVFLRFDQGRASIDLAFFRRLLAFSQKFSLPMVFIETDSSLGNGALELAEARRMRSEALELTDPVDAN